MANPRKPLRINVGFIINEEVGYNHEFPFDFEKIQIDEEQELRDFLGTAIIGRTPQGLLVQGDFSAEIDLECVRCLTDFSQPLHWTITELYAFNRKSLTDSGLLLPEDAHIDLQPLIREYALLEVPINPICRADCRGLCPVCGENLNERDCGHRPEQDNSPFSELKNLL